MKQPFLIRYLGPNYCVYTTKKKIMTDLASYLINETLLRAMQLVTPVIGVNALKRRDQ